MKLDLKQIILPVFRPNNSGQLGQYYGYWCPGSLKNQFMIFHRDPSLYDFSDANDVIEGPVSI